jgi:hypothetical protein
MNPNRQRKYGTLGLALIALTAAAWSCSPFTGALQPQGDGTYRLECKDLLSRCLRQVEERCSNYGYDILSASQQINRYGPEQLQTETFGSHAVVKCRGANALIGSSDDDSKEDPTATGEGKTSADSSATACVPGASQACVGVGGCSGGQACLPDGSAYGPCDCGSVASPPAVVTEPPPAPPAATEPSAPDTEQPPSTMPGTVPTPPVSPTTVPAEPLAPAPAAPGQAPPPANP